jgi:hypothetical protein
VSGERGLAELVTADPTSWSEPSEVPHALALWFDGEHRMVGTRDGLYRDGERVLAVDQALLWAGSEDRWIGVGAESLFDDRGQVVPYEGRVVDVDVDEERWLALICDEDCAALDSSGELGRAGERGRVDLSSGRACWSDPQAQPGGRVECEDGLRLEGLEGDHLGAALDGAWAAGQLNLKVVPNRLRIVPLDGGTVLSMDRYQPGMPPSLAVSEELVLGLPWGLEQGRVLAAALP